MHYSAYTEEAYQLNTIFKYDTFRSVFKATMRVVKAAEKLCGNVAEFLDLRRC